MRIQITLCLLLLCLMPQTCNAGAWSWVKQQAQDFAHWVEPALERIGQGAAKGTGEAAARKVHEFTEEQEERLRGYGAEKVSYPTTTSINFILSNGSDDTLNLRMFHLGDGRKLYTDKLGPIAPDTSLLLRMKPNETFRLFLAYKDSQGTAGYFSMDFTKEIILSGLDDENLKAVLYLEWDGEQLKPQIDPDTESYAGVGYWRGTPGFTPLRWGLEKRYSLEHNISHMPERFSKKAVLKTANNTLTVE